MLNTCIIINHRLTSLTFVKKINPQDKTVASLTDKELREMAGKDKEQNSRTYRDQLITIGDLEIFKQNLIEEIRNLLAQAPSSQSKKWLNLRK